MGRSGRIRPVHRETVSLGRIVVVGVDVDADEVSSRDRGCRNVGRRHILTRNYKFGYKCGRGRRKRGLKYPRWIYDSDSEVVCHIG